MEEKKKYIIVSGSCSLMSLNRAIEEMTHKVNKSIEDGYTCQGGLYDSNGYLLQAMVLNQNIDKTTDVHNKLEIV